MSMYNAIFGINPLSSVILSTLGLSMADTGRFRDCTVVKKDGELVIAVYTRNGGGNREQYMPDFSGHPDYMYDVDDDFDSTYATIYFSAPEKYLPVVESMYELMQGFDPDRAEDIPVGERFSRLIDKMEAGDQDDPVVQRAMDVGKKIMGKITTLTKGGQ